MILINITKIDNTQKISKTIIKAIKHTLITISTVTVRQVANIITITEPHKQAEWQQACLQHGVDPCSAVRRAGKKEVSMVRRTLNSVDGAIVGIKRQVDRIVQIDRTLHVTYT